MDNLDIQKWKEENNWGSLSPEQRISLLEKARLFDVDINDDPPSIELKPNKIDYLHEKWFSRVKTKIGNFFASRYINKLIKNKGLIIKDIVGLENLQKLETGAVITCNHFSPCDNFAVQKVFEKVQKPKQKMWKIIREGNYTNPPCLSFFFRNCDTLPLSSNTKTMIKFFKATKTALTRGDYILIYPEESMWMNYKKPKPLKIGAYQIAVKNNVPVVPIFITMKDSEILDGGGNPVQEYYIHILEPIYKRDDLCEKDNAKLMLQENYDKWTKVYEDFYNKKLTYDTNTETINEN